MAYISRGTSRFSMRVVTFPHTSIFMIKTDVFQEVFLCFPACVKENLCAGSCNLLAALGSEQPAVSQVQLSCFAV